MLSPNLPKTQITNLHWRGGALYVSSFTEDFLDKKYTVPRCFGEIQKTPVHYVYVRPLQTILPPKKYTYMFANSTQKVPGSFVFRLRIFFSNTVLPFNIKCVQFILVSEVWDFLVFQGLLLVLFLVASLLWAERLIWSLWHVFVCMLDSDPLP